MNRKIFSILCLVFGSIVFVQQTEAVTLNPVADTYVRDGSYATCTFGGSTVLQTKLGSAGYNRMAYFKFDISSVTGSISSAKLRVYGKYSATSGATATHAYSLTTDSWTESGMTWNNKPAPGSSLSSVTITSTTAKYYEWDVTSFVSSEKAAGQTLLSLILKHDVTCTGNNDFNSREASSNKPELVIITGTTGGGVNNYGTIIDEDFTDGLFDDFNSGTTGRNWFIYGGGDVGFKIPNSRSFPRSLARRPNGGGESWSGAKWAVWNDANGNGSFNDNEQQKFRVHKNEDIVVLKFKAFSDVAGNSSVEYGVEVAMLEWADALQPHPDYGHDLSFEGEQIFSIDSINQVQLFGNVENVQNWVNNARYAHHDGIATSTTLSRDYQNLLIWRNRPGTGKTNVEQWGALRSADYDVNSEMKGVLDPNNTHSVFDNIQIALFRESIDSGDLVRAGVAADNAQIGILHAHVGITKKSDYNLDYTVDIEDFFSLAAGWGVGNKTILQGDGSNDGNVDINDYNVMGTFWGFGTVQNVTRYAYDAPKRVSNTNLVAEVNVTTGRIRLIGNGQTVFGYKIRSGDGLVANAANNVWKTVYSTKPLHKSTTAEISDLNVNGSSISTWDLGVAYDVAKARRDLSLTWQNALGQTTCTGLVRYIQ